MDEGTRLLARSIGQRTALATFAALLLAPTLAQSIVFPVPQTEPLSDVPEAMGIGDLNGDGHPDVVVSNFVAQTVTIYLTDIDIDGDAVLFSLVGDFPSGGPGHRVLVQDVTGDLVADVVVSEQESDNIWLLRGVGDGTVGDPELINPGHDPVGVAARDLDGDDIVDLVVALADEAGGRLAVMMGRGDGQFELTQTIVLPDGSEGVALGYFDPDTQLDAAVTNTVAGSVSILHGIGGGMFGDPVNIPVGGGPSPIAIDDLDNDGFADLVIGNTADDTVAILWGRADGTFGDPQLFGTGGQLISGLVIGDVDGDSHIDVVTSNLRSQSLSVLFGRGGRSFAPARGFITEPNPVGVAAFDVDGDLTVDLLSANEGLDSAEPALTLLRGNASGGFDAIDQLPAPPGGSGVAVADFDEDAFADAVVAFVDAGVIGLFPGSPGPVPAPVRSFPVDASPTAVLAADVNRDGHADAVTLDASAQISVLLGSGTGDFAAAVHRPLAARGRAFAAADVDHDGDPDLFVVDVSGKLTVLLNDGAGGLTALAPIMLPVQASDVVVGDFNGDGNVDVAVNQTTVAQILVFQGDGQNGFGAPVAVSTGGVVFAAAPGDLDGNGTLDLLISSPAQRGVFPLINDGTGMFTLGTKRFGGTFPASVTLRDLNNDGFPEAIVNDQLDNRAVVLVNDGAGALESDADLFASVAPTDVVSGDFDGDGRYDIFTVGRTVCRLHNITEPTAPVLRGDANGDQRLTAADFIALALELHDGDGERAEDTPRGTYAGNPGADADGDGSVTETDARALRLRIFRGPSGS